VNTCELLCVSGGVPHVCIRTYICHDVCKSWAAKIYAVRPFGSLEAFLFGCAASL
jgi:hypothetical protein